MEKTKGSNIFQIVLVALLVGAAFYIGGLSSKVDRLEKDAEGTDSANTGEKAVPVFDTAEIASAIGIDAEAFKSCVENRDAQKYVEEEQAAAVKAGVSGTPGIYLYDSKTENAVVIPGAVDLDTMQTFLDGLLASRNFTIGNSEFEVAKIPDLQLLTEGDFIRGDRNARVILFEYSDYDCPFCTRVHPTIQSLLDNNSGVVSWVYRQFPLPQLHPQAITKSEAAICAGWIGGNDGFWAYTDMMLK